MQFLDAFQRILSVYRARAVIFASVVAITPVASLAGKDVVDRMSDVSVRTSGQSAD